MSIALLSCAVFVVAYLLGGAARASQDRAYWRTYRYCVTCNRLSTKHEADFIGTDLEDGAA